MAWIQCLAALFFSSTVAAISNFSFSYNPLDYNAEGLQKVSNVTFSQFYVHLNDDNGGSGKIYYKDPIRFKNSTNVASFNTSFIFEINYTSTFHGDGMTFFIQANPEAMAGGGSLGLVRSAENPFLAVEFDTYQNSPADRGAPYWYDPPGDHVGIDLNSMSSAANHSASIANKQQKACIDYDAQTQMLVLRLANDSVQCPSEPIISAQVDLRTLFKNNDSLHVGFSASTGTRKEAHLIYSWSFYITEISDPSKTPDLPPPHAKDSSNKLLVIILAVLIPTVVATCGIITWLLCYKRTRKGGLQQISESQLLQMSLHRFSYADMSTATKGFSHKEVLGKGGFGSVYRGILPSDGSMVAVKVMSVEGHQQFMAELSIIGRLKHKNLVGLRGWCYQNDKLILVYDYMPNGSLDQHLFSQDKLLSWSQRYEIIKGAAEGLSFLHGGWEQRIVHRDIKAANVLLDSNFVARLGDFGLSKLMENNKTQQTMTHAGTRGYIAPELAYIGRASEKSDIYSFGILLLEVGCGRSVLVLEPETQEYHFLLEWVWEAHLLDALLAVADPRLELEYDEEQMRLVLILGLLCSHPDADQRPSTRRCCQILNGEAILPSLPKSKPTMVFGLSQRSSSRNASPLLSHSTVNSSSSSSSALPSQSSGSNSAAALLSQSTAHNSATGSVISQSTAHNSGSVISLH